MAEELQSIKGTKAEIYESLIPQIQFLIQGETDLVANLANITAALKETFGWLWVGFYLVRNNELVLGPFQGPIACTRIGYGKGVCGTAWKDRKSYLVPDVGKFPGHIACSSSSVAEIVVPILNSKAEVTGVIDVDSECFDVLDEIDRVYLEKISQTITVNLFT
ncbi:MAG: GAF domain-containing protein [Paludibacter sp.]